MLDYIFAVLEWCKVAIFLRGKERRVLFKEGEIWWCSIGMNVGNEIFGKGSKFERPVLILKKFYADFFFGIPITSKTKRGDWYVPISLGGKGITAILNQGRTFDAKRLIKKVGTLNAKDWQSVQIGFDKLYRPINANPAERAGSDLSPEINPENGGKSQI